MKNQHYKLQKMTIQELTAKDAKDRAKEYAEPLDSLIKPEWEFDTDQWEQVDKNELEQEIWFSIDIMMSEINSHYQLKDILYTRSITVYKNDLSRCKMEHLAFDDKNKALKKGFWPNKMDKFECMERLQEIYTVIEDLPVGYYEKAYSEVSSGLFEGTWPKGVER